MDKQRTIKLRVVVRPWAGENPQAENGHPCRQSLVGCKERAESLPAKCGVLTIFGGPYKVGNRCHTQDTKRPPQVMMHIVGIHPTRGTKQKPRDIVFIEADANWVHHPHKDALVVTAKIANNIIHRMLGENGSASKILFWGPLSEDWANAGWSKPDDHTSIRVYMGSCNPRRNY